jgi:hypothetical protein
VLVELMEIWHEEGGHAGGVGVQGLVRGQGGGSAEGGFGRLCHVLFLLLGAPYIQMQGHDSLTLLHQKAILTVAKPKFLRNSIYLVIKYFFKFICTILTNILPKFALTFVAANWYFQAMVLALSAHSV